MLAVIVPLALGLAPKADPLVARFLASPAAAPLLRPGGVRAARVDSVVSSWEREPRPPDAESLGFAGLFRVRPEGQTLGAQDGGALRRILGRTATYTSDVSACAFEPGVAFTFPARSDLLVLVCFQCEEVGFAQGTKGLKMLGLTKTGKEQLLEITTRLFPELKTTASK